MNIVRSYFRSYKGIKKYFKVQIIVYLINDNHSNSNFLLLEFGLIFVVLMVLMEAEPNPSTSITNTKIATLIVSIGLCYRCE